MRKVILLISLLIAFISPPTYAELNLTLTQGISGAVPIAVVPFDGQLGDISTVVSNDLQNSGRFKSLDVSQMPSQPHDANDVKFDDWKSLKQNNLVVGSMNKEGG